MSSAPAPEDEPVDLTEPGEDAASGAADDGAEDHAPPQEEAPQSDDVVDAAADSALRGRLGAHGYGGSGIFGAGSALDALHQALAAVHLDLVSALVRVELDLGKVDARRDHARRTRARKRDHVDFAPKDFDRARAFLAEEREAKKAPMEKLAAQLLDKERQRIAAMQATDVTLTRGGRGSDGTSDSDDDDDDVRRARDEAEDDDFDDDEGGGGDDDDDDDDAEFDGMEDEDVLAALASRAGAAGGTAGGLTVRPTLPPKRAAAEGDEDVVEDLVFSDDEDEPAKKKKKKRRV